MKHVLFGALIALALAIPAAARKGQEVGIALSVNSGAAIEIGDDGTGVAELEGEELAPPTPWVRSVAMHFTGGQYDWAIGEKSAMLRSGDTGVASDPVVPDQIHIAFRAIGDSDQRLLVIANGYDRALVYRAHLRVNGNDQYTDVCTVLPGNYGFEHWPYASDRILLTDLRLEEWSAGTPPRCQ